jgi:hypothetical protein
MKYFVVMAVITFYALLKSESIASSGTLRSAQRIVRQSSDIHYSVEFKTLYDMKSAVWLSTDG